MADTMLTLTVMIALSQASQPAQAQPKIEIIRGGSTKKKAKVASSDDTSQADALAAKEKELAAKQRDLDAKNEQLDSKGKDLEAKQKELDEREEELAKKKEEEKRRSEAQQKAAEKYQRDTSSAIGQLGEALGGN